MKTNRLSFIGKLSGKLAIFCIGALCGYFMNYAGLLNSEANSSTIVICHKEAGKDPRTMIISTSALNGHLQHGDQIGGCLTASDADPTKLR